MSSQKRKNKMMAGIMAFLIAVSPFASVLSANAATLEQEWSKNVGTAEIDQVLTMAKTSDGGYVVGGYTNVDIDADQGQNYLLAKLDASGNQVWLIHLGGNAGFDVINEVIETSNGGLAVVGETAGGMGAGGAIEAGGFVLSLDANGNEIWSKNVGQKSNDHFTSIVQTSDGGFAVAGVTNADLDNGRIGNYDGAVIKLDSDGNTLWAKNVGTTDFDSLNSIIQTNDGGFIAAGTIMNENFDPSDGLIIKLDANGNQVWEKSVGTSRDERINKVIQTSDGGFAVAGMTAGDLGNGYLGSEDGMVINFNKDGNQIWSQNIGTSSTDTINSLIQTSDGGYAVGGMTYGDLGSGNLGGNDGLMAKLDSKGNQVWAKNVGTDQFDQIFAIVETNDGGYAVAGSTAGGLSNGNQGQDDGFVIKFSPVFTISFDSNGATGNMESQSGFTKTVDQLNANQFANTGKVFGGWATSKENAQNGIWAYTDGQSVTYTQDMTLYAIWTTPTAQKFTVAYVSNGGSAVAGEKVDKGATATQPSDPTRDGYIFQGWYTNKTLTNQYDFNSKVTQDITLYAKWKAISHPDAVEGADTDEHNKGDSNTPQTGDPESGMAFLLMVLGLSASVLCGITVFQRKRKSLE